jgi:hypothetical protein
VIVLAGCLVILSLYLGKRLSDANTENSALRTQVASLKRQLAKRRA